MNKLQARSRATRHYVELEGFVVFENGTEHRVIIRDYSIDGCCITGLHTPGESLTLRLANVGKLQGRIQWARLGEAGVRFDRSAGR
jgi:hypothetical protein